MLRLRSICHFAAAVVLRSRSIWISCCCCCFAAGNARRGSIFMATKTGKKSEKKKRRNAKKKKRFYLPSTPDLPCASSSPTRFALILPRTSASIMSPFCRHRSGGDTSFPCESPLSTIDCAQGSASQHRSTIATFGKISAWTFHHARMFTF